VRKLIVWNLVTLDGFFEGTKKWDLGWHEDVWGDELEQLSITQARSIGMLLFGRVTYEGMATYWRSATGQIADFMNDVPKVVFSKTLDQADWKNTRLVKGSPAEEVVGLKQQVGKDLFIFGSADLSSTLTEDGLIDEYRLCMTPIVLGSGTPLFKPRPQRLRMTLLETTPLKSGCVILRYAPQKRR